MENKKTIKMICGFEAQVDEDTMDDIRVFELMVEHDRGDRYTQVMTMPKIIELLLGKEQKEAFYGYLIEKDGKPKISVLEKEILHIFESFNERKKK